MRDNDRKGMEAAFEVMCKNNLTEEERMKIMIYVDSIRILSSLLSLSSNLQEESFNENVKIIFDRFESIRSNLQSTMELTKLVATMLSQKEEN